MTTIAKNAINQIQASLFTSVDPSIIVWISEDQSTITASNISEDTFANLKLVTNNPQYPIPMQIVGIQVYLNNNKYPTNIFGLFDFVFHKAAKSDTDAFVNNQKIHQPFINGWQNGITIGQLVDTLSALSPQVPDTHGIVKTFTLIMDPPIVTQFEVPTTFG